MADGLSANCLFSLAVKRWVDMFVATSQNEEPEKVERECKWENERGRDEV